MKSFVPDRRHDVQDYAISRLTKRKARWLSLGQRLAAACRSKNLEFFFSIMVRYDDIPSVSLEKRASKEEAQQKTDDESHETTADCAGGHADQDTRATGAMLDIIQRDLHGSSRLIVVFITFEDRSFCRRARSCPAARPQKPLAQLSPAMRREHIFGFSKFEDTSNRTSKMALPPDALLLCLNQLFEQDDRARSGCGQSNYSTDMAKTIAGAERIMPLHSTYQ